MCLKGRLAYSLPSPAFSRSLASIAAPATVVATAAASPAARSRRPGRRVFRPSSCPCCPYRSYQRCLRWNPCHRRCRCRHRRCRYGKARGSVISKLQFCAASPKKTVRAHPVRSRGKCLALDHCRARSAVRVVHKLELSRAGIVFEFARAAPRPLCAHPRRP